MTGDSGQSSPPELGVFSVKAGLRSPPHTSHETLCNVWAKSPWRCRSRRGQSPLGRLICGQRPGEAKRGQRGTGEDRRGQKGIGEDSRDQEKTEGDRRRQKGIGEDSRGQ